MNAYRWSLPQLGGKFFLTDGGIETTLIFLESLDLPHFSAIDALRTAEGGAALSRYFRAYLALAERFGTGLVLETATWRASADWGRKLGYGAGELRRLNERAVRMLEDLRVESATAGSRAVISGCIGPRGDGYSPGAVMSESESEAYHSEQARLFAESAADMIAAITMNYVEEAIGIARAAASVEMPVAISFTVETDGRLPTGQALGAAIEQVDAATSGYPAYYMVNCAHSTHFDHVLDVDRPWTRRIRGLRANASSKSHAELNDSPELDIGDPEEFGRQYAALRRRHPQINVMGGCCGTDYRHIEQVALSCAALF
jgi:S-methylmethionine-dependent homocysteine/selenocysteine methylase